MDAQHLDAKLEAVEARTDTKFSVLMGEIKSMAVDMRSINNQVSKVDKHLDKVEETLSNMKWHMVYIGIAIVTAIIAVLAYGLQMFDAGLSAH
jgi:hypothetical protein